MGMVSNGAIMFNVYNWKDVHEIGLHSGSKINKQQNTQESSWLPRRSGINEIQE